ncbi:TonB-dependent receptor domain-containing protein [Ideonella sp. BN130291]|uniref:TonB-dependent receptor domain-containing protein n=1 Tax=Ideonella sp. BN130291 TaxID=3112940 RepID=UPI002E26DFA5|nr:TonB-dependent receptor [Ideonella sp. BN130291]
MFKPKLSAVATAVAVITSLGASAHAQDAAQRVEITGSRILSTNAVSPAPVQVLTSADIAASGAVNLQELILKSPVFGTPGISRTNSNFITSSVGIATVDLRNLGADRTLVLVNGRRYVAGQSGSATVDLNTIPTDFIERVEVLTGGASSAYGSDAVGGVVNIILKKSIDGIKLDASYGESQKHDDTLKKFSASFGSNSGDGKTRMMGHFSVTQQGAVYSKDRDISAVDGFSAYVGGFSDDPADLFTNHTPFYSSFAPQGRFFFRTAGGSNTSRTFDADGNLIPFSTNGPNGDGVGATGYNRNEVRTIAVPTNRLLFAANGEHEFSEKATVFFEGTYAATKTTSRLEPFAVDSTGGTNPIYAGGGFVPAEFLVNGVLVKNPLIPQALFDQLTDRDSDGARDYNFTRRLTDIANRGNTANRDTFRFLTGLKGELTKTWNYDVYTAYGYTKEAQYGTGQVNAANFRYALEAIPDANGNPVCRDPVARASGCVPVNVFGANTISPEAARYIHAPSTLNTKITQSFTGATLSGEPVELPAGPLGMAFGVEYRKEASSDVADALTQLGLNLGNARPITEGSFNVKEAFAEFRVPLLKGLPAVKSLDGTVAVRSAKYSTGSNTTSWNTGLDWAVNSTFRFRATSAVSTRAPNIGELFQGPNQTFPTGLVDPCVGVTATSTGAVSEACRQDAGVLANIAQNGAFTLTQADLQGISGYNLGNPNLQPEKGKSVTLGMVITSPLPADLGNMNFTVDYYRIQIDKAINSPGRQFQLTQCYGGDPKFCKDITRRQVAVGANSAGALQTINSSSENTGGQFDEGVDLTANYAGKIAGGSFFSRLSYTHLLKAWVKTTPDAERDYSTGELGAARNRWVLNLGYDIGNFGLKSSVTYIGQSYVDDQFMIPNEIPKEFGKVGAKTYTDAQLTYKFGKAEAYFGINNLLNTKPPLIPSGVPGNSTGVETMAGTYDPIGRRYYVGVRYSL